MPTGHEERPVAFSANFFTQVFSFSWAVVHRSHLMRSLFDYVIDVIIAISIALVCGAKTQVHTRICLAVHHSY